MVKLRAHHLLCMLTFEGMGYTETFSQKFREMLGRIEAGEPIELVDGPDEACQTILDDLEPPHRHCLLARITARDRLALTAVSSVLNLPLVSGTRFVLTSGMISTLRTAFAEGRVRRACTQCQWTSICTASADTGFARSVMRHGTLSGIEETDHGVR
jgi:uncharacterized protein